MRPLWAAALLGLSAAAQAATADLYADCARIDDQKQLALISREFQTQTLAFAAVDTTSTGRASEGEVEQLFVRNWDDVRRFLLMLPRSCQKLKYLFIATHGGPGFITFNDGPDGPTIVELDTNLPRKLEGLSQVLAPGAEVHLGGCSVARKCEGENFAYVMAGLLLRSGGGTFRAERSDQASFLGITRARGIRAAHIIDVARGGRPTFRRDTIERDDCRRQLTRALDRLSACGASAGGRAQPEAAADLQAALSAYDGMPQRFATGRRPFLTMVGYNSSLTRYEAARKCGQ